MATVPSVADLVRIPRVPILSTGTYSLSTGEFTFTTEDLQAAASAPSSDPAVQWPRIRIDGLSDSFDQAAHGGEPAFGRIENMVVDGETLYGDYVIPPGLAAVIDWAFPSRSIEGAPGSIMGPTATGRTHELVITAVALLGVDLPGVSTLPDLMDVLAQFGGDAQPEQVAVMATVSAATADARIVGHPPNEGAIHAGLDQELVRRRFFDATESQDETVPIPEGERGYDLWIRSLRFDDDGSPFLVVEAWESGRLYRYGFAVSGNDVNFTLIGEVVEQYVAASAAGRRSPVAVWATRDESRAVMASQQEANPGMTEEQRRLLAAANGLDPDTATEADIMAAAQAAATARADTPPEPTTEPEPVAEQEPVAASAAEARTVTITAAQHRQQQDELATLRARLDQRDATDTAAHRDGLIAAACADGRIAPSEREQWRADLNDAPEATERILARLTPNRIPVAARGVDRQENGGTESDEAQYQATLASYGARPNRRDVGGVTMVQDLTGAGL